jgi:hypothetical protein
MTARGYIACSALPDTPPHFNLLTDHDRAHYLVLRDRFRGEVSKSKKGERLDSFTEKLKEIKRFTDRGDEDDWKRSFVCGVFFLSSNALAVSIQQFRVLLGRCKSSINGSLQQLGYTADPPPQNLTPDFLSKIPQDRRDMGDLKKWTIRRSRIEVELAVEPFVICLPEKVPETVHTEAIQKLVEQKFPCPVKCRYKYHEIMYQSVSIQTEV